MTKEVARLSTTVINLLFRREEEVLITGALFALTE